MSFPPGQQGPSIDSALVLKIFCLVIDHERTPQGQPFPISCSTGGTVGDLKEMVKEKKPNDLGGVDADHLTVWRCMDELDETDPTALASRVKDAFNGNKCLRLGPRRILDSAETSVTYVVEKPFPVLATKLLPSSDLLDFKYGPEAKAYKHISILCDGKVRSSTGFDETYVDRDSRIHPRPKLADDPFKHAGTTLLNIYGPTERNNVIENQAKKKWAEILQQGDTSFPNLEVVVWHYMLFYHWPSFNLRLSDKAYSTCFHPFVQALQQVREDQQGSEFVPCAKLQCSIDQRLIFPLLAHRCGDIKNDKGEVVGQENEYCQYTPRPDFAISDEEGFPRIVVEIQSDPLKKADLYRMYLYCAALVRLTYLVYTRQADREKEKFEYEIYMVYMTKDGGDIWRMSAGDPKPDEYTQRLSIDYRPIDAFAFINTRDRFNFITTLYKIAQQIPKLHWLKSKHLTLYTDFVKGLKVTLMSTMLKNTANKQPDISKRRKRKAPNNSSGTQSKRYKDSTGEGGGGQGGNSGGGEEGNSEGEEGNSEGEEGNSEGEEGNSEGEEGNSEGEERDSEGEERDSEGEEQDSEEEEWHWRGPQTISSEDCLERADIVKIALEVTRTTRERVETDEMIGFGPHCEIRTVSSRYFAKLTSDDNELNILRSLKEHPHPHIIQILSIVNLDSVRRNAVVMPRGIYWEVFRCNYGFKTHVFGSVIGFLSGVKFLHDCGVAHLDLKPDNLVFLDSKVQIIDFGCATTEEYVKKGGIVGTKGFMAPEVSEGSPYYPKKADLFSTGKVVTQFADEIRYDYDHSLSWNLRELSTLLTNRTPSKRLNLSSLFDFYNPHLVGGGEISESKIDEIIGSFIAHWQERSRSRRLLPPGSSNCVSKRCSPNQGNGIHRQLPRLVTVCR